MKEPFHMEIKTPTFENSYNLSENKWNKTTNRNQMKILNKTFDPMCSLTTM